MCQFFKISQTDRLKLIDRQTNPFQLTRFLALRPEATFTRQTFDPAGLLRSHNAPPFVMNYGSKLAFVKGIVKGQFHG
jgi:hypothetical protein